MVVNMNNPPAFPSGNDVTLGDWRSHGHSGMTLRDYFAAKAMQSFLDEVGSGSDQRFYKDIAIGAYQVADAMLKAREE
jgi:pimeloyl-ACP methyl ester carboxylesterase